jgi:hypothetical protein
MRERKSGRRSSREGRRGCCSLSRSFLSYTPKLLRSFGEDARSLAGKPPCSRKLVLTEAFPYFFFPQRRPRLFRFSRPPPMAVCHAR